ncbi:hypothetical protein KHP60_14250 [Microvirga sp. 3-52]|uniref:hypothetical protein n=1 Tax=Microvirga sp. 3-52 TaxID=2792425 RepID=UPI001AC5155E|nr:hypothetical protein [Microvirga sp. 3-52]MBO1906338.1 hypothetical protein [Microvirga sp. 3-52]MBS7453490.1 hypothetical protein [Microvirga sp. 3-52]
MKIAVGDEVRVHLHPAGPWKSFSEGVVRRVDVTTPEGRFFVLEVKSEVLLDQPHRIRPDFHDYVEYECRNDFPGRIEVLSAAPDAEPEPSLDLTLMDLWEETKQEANDPPPINAETRAWTEVEQIPEADAASEPTQVEIDRQPAPARSGLIATLFGRKE